LAGVGLSATDCLLEHVSAIDNFIACGYQNFACCGDRSKPEKQSWTST
jgi:hypothetical protein